MLDNNTKALLPTIMKDTMDALTALTNAPDEMTLPITLAVANFAVQALYNVHPMAWKSCAISEYFACLTPSGGMKTSISDLCMEGLRRYEREQEQANAQAQVDYLIECKKFTKAVDEAAKTAGGAGPTKPVKPKGSRYKVEKATVNGLINTLDSVPFAGLFSSDAGEFFNSHSFQDSNKSIEMITTLSKAWSGEDLDRVTGIEDNNVRLHNRRFNMLVLLQQELAGFLNNSQYKDQGFTNRMLITQCELFAKKEGDFGDEGQAKTDYQNSLLTPFNERVYKLLDQVETAQIGARAATLDLPGGTNLEKLAARAEAAARQQSNPNELYLDNIEFSKEDGARMVMQDFFNEMAKASMSPEYAEYANFMSRAYEHCCRLAATLAVFDLKTEISVRYAECAVGLMRYFIDQRMNLTVDGAVKINPIVECGEAVMKWLRKQVGREASKQDLVQRGPNAYRRMTTEDRTKVICDLEARELIDVSEVPGAGAKAKFMVRVTDVATVEISSRYVATAVATCNSNNFEANA